jgi:hypothetical protein
MMEIPQDLTALDDAALEALDFAVADEREALRLAQKPILVERERRQVAAEAAAKIASLSDEEKAALRQALALDGIEAPEA